MMRCLSLQSPDCSLQGTGVTRCQELCYLLSEAVCCGRRNTLEEISQSDALHAGEGV